MYAVFIKGVFEYHFLCDIHASTKTEANAKLKVIRNTIFACMGTKPKLQIVKQ